MIRIKTLFIIVVFTSLLLSCGSKRKENEVLIRKVKVAQVKRNSNNEQKKVSGVVKEARAVNLSFRVAGPIAKVYVDEGQFVKKGKLIAEMDRRDYELQYSVAQAEYEKVISETSRVSELYKRKGVTDAEYQKALAGQKMITAKRNRAKDQLDDTKLYAPFSGCLHSLNYDVGELVDIGMPIATLIDLSSFHVDIDIPTSLYLNRSKFSNFTCKLNLPNSKEIPLELLHTQVKSGHGQLYRMVFKLSPQADERITSGMEVSVFINYNSDNKMIPSVPVSAIFNFKGESYVWVLDQESSVVSKIKVVSGELNDDGTVQINIGLKGDETIVVAGVNELNEGEKVEVIKPMSKTNVGGLL